MPQRFFSIVVPAHNEEAIIDKTLRHLKELDYPKHRHEVVVIENGSNDATYEKAQQHVSENVKIFRAEKKGVSHARNFGRLQCSPNHDWCIFMDADVSLHPGFLKELDEHLEAHPLAGYGTTTVNLDDNSLTARFWSFVNNLTFRLNKFLYTIHIVRNDLASKVAYDEELTSGEDVVYGKALAKLGTYFFMPTKGVKTSDRRFKKHGYLRMFFVNLYRGILTLILPKRLLKRLDWEVVR